MWIVCPCLLEYLGVSNCDIITTLQRTFSYGFIFIYLLACFISSNHFTLFPQNTVPGVDSLVKE